MQTSGSLDDEDEAQPPLDLGEDVPTDFDFIDEGEVKPNSALGTRMETNDEAQPPSDLGTDVTTDFDFIDEKDVEPGSALSTRMEGLLSITSAPSLPSEENN